MASITRPLEVVLADFSKYLAQIPSDEEAAAAEYKRVSKENQIERTTKDQAAKYETQEAKALDKTAAELNSDRTGVQAELDAVSEYLSKFTEVCIAKTESYTARRERVEAELAGLRTALQILESEDGPGPGEGDAHYPRL